MPLTTDLLIREIEDTDLSSVIELWQSTDLTRPWNDPRADIEQARRKAHSKVLVGLLQDSIVASVMVGDDGHRGWVYYLAVDPHCHGQGFGHAMMDAAENWLRQRGVSKLNLLVRGDNTKVRAFYERAGYTQSDVICYQKSLG